MNSQAQLQGWRIVITGFMCAGKTTVARALAARLDCASLDTDAAIVERTGRSIEAIIEEDGEARFRQIETEVLRDCLENREARIIALGGGAWTLAGNRALIAAHEDCLTVWLDAPFELCWRRLTNADHARPLAREREQARKLYTARRAFYSFAALPVHVGADETAEAIALRIISSPGQPPPQTTS